MKRGFSLVLTFVLIIIIFSTPFVSAELIDWFKDLFNIGEKSDLKGNVGELASLSGLDNRKLIILGEAEAYFKFDYPPAPETFIFKLTDPEKIQEARDILSGEQTDAIHVEGDIVEGYVDYNPPYDYHLDPDSISFFENAIELCDAGIFNSYPEEYCSQYPPEQCTWCPWGSRLIEEIKILDEDVNEDGVVNIQDLVAVALQIGYSGCNTNNNWCNRRDVTRDGLVNIQDLVRVAIKCGCTPDCTGKECGDDGCGGSCGTCEAGFECISGKCVENQIPLDYIAYYKFEDNANDETGSNNGVIKGNPEFVEGRLGKAIHLNGIKDYVQVDESSDFDLSNFTYSVWINADTSNGSDTIIDIDNDEQLLATNSENYSIFGRCGNNPNEDYGSVKTGSWYHLAWSVSGSDYVIYEDGVVIGSGSGCSSSADADHLMIGSGYGGNEYFDGIIDEVKIWGYALTEEEVKKEYKAGNIQISLATLKNSYGLDEKIELTDPPEDIEKTIKQEDSFITAGLDYEETDKSLPKGYIIEFEDKPLVIKYKEIKKLADENENRIKSMGDLNPLKYGYQLFLTTQRNLPDKLNSYKSDLKNNRNKIIKSIKIKLDKKDITRITGNVVAENPKNLNVLAEYENVYNGIVLNITKDEAEEIKKIKGIKNIYPNLEVYATLMDSVPLIGAYKVWGLDENGSDCSVSGKSCLTGKGITIGIIDTGIDYTNSELCKDDPRCGNIIWNYFVGYSRIYENKIIWIDRRNKDSDIYMYDLLTGEETLITDEFSNFEGLYQGGSHPDIYDNFIVYDDYPYTKIYIYDLTTRKETQISDSNNKTLEYPKIYGNKIVYTNITYQGKPNYKAFPYIFMYDISTGKTIEITNNSGRAWIYENKIVYLGSKDNSASLSMYDLSTEKEIPINFETQGYLMVDIYGDIIAWCTHLKKMEIYNLQTQEKIKTPYECVNLEVFEDKIVFNYGPTTSGPIYVYDIPTGIVTQISKEGHYDSDPHIYENKIVYSENKYRETGEIFMYDLNTEEEIQITKDHSTDSNISGLFPNEKVIGGYDFVYKDNNPIDDNGHGTHCAGIAAGIGSGGLKGVAPDAKLYAFKVLNRGGSGTDSDIIDAIEMSVDLNNNGIPCEDENDFLDIISLSLGGEGDPDDPMSTAIDNAVEAGVIAVVAAGNSGPGESTIKSPGTSRKAITVGATFKKDYEGEYWEDINPKTDQITGFSSRGPVVWDGGSIDKPDIVAPGAIICSAQYDSAFKENKCYDDKHVEISGTSMSTPMVAGAVALIKQKNPDWTPEQIKEYLMNNAIDLGYDKNVQGSGRINLLNMIEEKPQSKLVNLGPDILTGNLKIILQKNENENWVDEEIVVDETVSIPANGLIKLDTGKDNLGNQVFDGFNNLDVKLNNLGTYKVYAEFNYGSIKINSEWIFNVI